MHAGANVNLPDHSGLTAFHWAVHRGHESIVTLLVDLAELDEDAYSYRDTDNSPTLDSLRRTFARMAVQLHTHAHRGEQGGTHLAAAAEPSSLLQEHVQRVIALKIVKAERAVTKIQAAYRGWRVREAQRRQEEIMDLAALKIQAAYRSYHRRATTNPASAARGREDRRLHPQHAPVTSLERRRREQAAARGMQHALAYTYAQQQQQQQQVASASDPTLLGVQPGFTAPLSPVLPVQLPQPQVTAAAAFTQVYAPATTVSAAESAFAASADPSLFYTTPPLPLPSLLAPRSPLHPFSPETTLTTATASALEPTDPALQVIAPIAPIAPVLSAGGDMHADLPEQEPTSPLQLLSAESLEDEL